MIWAERFADPDTHSTAPTSASSNRELVKPVAWEVSTRAALYEALPAGDQAATLSPSEPWQVHHFSRAVLTAAARADWWREARTDVLLSDCKATTSAHRPTAAPLKAALYDVARVGQPAMTPADRLPALSVLGPGGPGPLITLCRVKPQRLRYLVKLSMGCLALFVSPCVPPLLRQAREEGWGDLIGYLFIGPAVLVYIAFNAYPLIRGLIIAFSDYRYLLPDHSPFNGIDNWVEMSQDPLFWSSLGRSFYYAILYVILNFVIAFFVALLISQIKSQREASAYRVIAYLPVVLPIAVALLVWKQLLSPEFGYISYFLKQVLHFASAPEFLKDAAWAVPVLAISTLMARGPNGRSAWAISTTAGPPGPAAR